jgi:hypothetical protein
MGGAPDLPRVVEFRGIWTDADTAALLVELAAISGSIYVDPIAGCGSWQGSRVRTPDGTIITLGSTKASAETHTGDGVVDLNCEHLTDAEARALETYCRMLGCAAWFRPAVSPYTGNRYGWQRHVHLIRLDAANLPAAARAQVTAYRNRLDGLAVPHADRGSHAYLGRTWAAYLREKDDTMTPAQLQTILAAINDTPRRVWAWPIANRRNPKARWSAQSWLEGGNLLTGDTLAVAKKIAGQAGVDVDEQAIARGVAALVGPDLRAALVAELSTHDKVEADEVADAVIARLGAALVEPAA